MQAVYDKRRRNREVATALEGKETRKKTVDLAGVGAQTLRDWAGRYNKEGVAGLAT